MHVAALLRSLRGSGLHLPGVSYRILGLTAPNGITPIRHVHGDAGLRVQGESNLLEN